MAEDARRNREDLRAGGRCYATPRARVLEAVIGLADADSEDDRAYHAAWVRLRKALIETGWTPPARQHA